MVRIPTALSLKGWLYELRKELRSLGFLALSVVIQSKSIFLVVGLVIEAGKYHICIRRTETLLVRDNNQVIKWGIAKRLSSIDGPNCFLK